MDELHCTYQNVKAVVAVPMTAAVEAPAILEVRRKTFCVCEDGCRALLSPDTPAQ